MMGRPKRTLSSKDREAIAEMLDRHCSWTQIAKGLRMDYVTLRRLRDEDAELKQMVDEAMEAERADLHGTLYDVAVNERNIIACMFLLKTRHGYRENAPVDMAVNGNVIMLQAPATPEDYARMLAQGSNPTSATMPAIEAQRALPAAEVERG